MIPRQVSSKTQINLREVSQLTTEVKQLYDAGNHKAALSLLLKLTNARNMPLPLLAVLHSLIIEFAPQNLPYLSIEEIAAHYRLVEQYPNTTINPEKTLWLGDQFLLAEKLEPALEFYAKIKVHHSLPLQITALYNIGLTYTKKGDMNKEALAKFEACVVIFRKNKKMLTKTKLPVARAAHCAAVIFDDADSNLSNPEKALKYYQIAAGFDLSESLHNLGYKYENGEDVEINYDLAEHYYRRAANQDYSNSVLNLANMLYGLNKHIDDLLVRLEKIEDDARVYHTLGVIYFERYNANKEAKKFAKKAHRNLLKASKLGHAGSTKNLGIMHYLGMEIPVNLTEAEKCFKFATENGIDAYDCLAVVYQAKLAQEDDELNQQTIILYTLDALKKAGHHLNDIDTQSHDEKLATLLELKLLLNVQSFGINQNIVETAKNNSLAKIKRIELILEHEIVTLDTLNLVTAIQRIGRLTAASPGARDFHQQQFPKILLLIQEAELRFNAGVLELSVINNLIEGISKLYSHSDPLLDRFIHRLYQEILNRIEEFELDSLINITYAATRFQTTHPIFKKNLIYSIISFVIDRLETVDVKYNASMIYALALFDNALPKITSQISKQMVIDFIAIKLSDFKSSVNLASNTNKIKYLFADDLIEIRQLYCALFYFTKKYLKPKDNTCSQLLSYWRNYLNCFNPATEESHLQKTVTHFLAQYIPLVEPEKIINTLPVDAFFTIDNKIKFILQVDGPSHFLHDAKGISIPTMKTLFRNECLQFSYPVICVSYVAWQSLENDEARYQHLANALKEVNIIIQNSKWLLVKTSSKQNITSYNSNSSQAESSRFFNHRKDDISTDTNINSKDKSFTLTKN